MNLLSEKLLKVNRLLHGIPESGLLHLTHVYNDIITLDILLSIVETIFLCKRNDTNLGGMEIFLGYFFVIVGLKKIQDVAEKRSTAFICLTGKCLEKLSTTVTGDELSLRPSGVIRMIQMKKITILATQRIEREWRSPEALTRYVEVGRKSGVCAMALLIAQGCTNFEDA